MTSFLIVGGGPAGLSLATQLAARNHRVTIIDRGQWPIDKVCGEGLLPSATRQLTRLGISLAPATPPTDGQGWPIRELRFYDRGKRGPSVRFAPGEAYGLCRRQLSARLFERLQRCASATILDKTRLIGLTSIGGRASRYEGGINQQVRVLLARQGQREEAQFDWVIGADGVHSTVRRLAQIPQLDLLPRRVGVRAHYTVKEGAAPNHVQVHWQRGYEIYVTPVASNQIQIATLFDPSTAYPKEASPFLKRVLQESTAIQSLLATATPLPNTRWRAHGPLGVRANTPVCGRVILIGDAHCFWDGITGEGVALALQQASIVARQDFDHFNPEQLTKNLQQTLGRYLFWTRAALLLSRHLTLRKAAFSVLKANPRLFAMVTRHLMDDRAFFDSYRKEGHSTVDRPPTKSLT